MKNFTLKDFIFYHNTCKICQKETIFSFQYNENYCIPKIIQNMFCFEFYKYSNKICLLIDPVTNSFSISDSQNRNLLNNFFEI